MSSTTTPRFSPRELAARVESGQISIIDVREPMEYVGGHIPGSQNIPLSRLGSTSLP